MDNLIKDPQQYQQLTLIATLFKKASEYLNHSTASVLYVTNDLTEKFEKLGEKYLVDAIKNTRAYVDDNIRSSNSRFLTPASDFMRSYFSTLAETFTLAAANAIGGIQAGTASHCSGHCNKETVPNT